MAKGETKETYKDSKALGADVKAQYGQAATESKALAGEMQSSVNDQRGALTGYYQGMMKPSAVYTPTSYNASHASAQGYDASTYDAAQAAAAKKIDNSSLTALQPALQDFATTGGFAPGREDSIMSTVNQLKNNGGLSDENIARIRGNGMFDEFANTGGYDATARANIKAQALSPISSMASTTRDELDRRRAVQGGYAPGFDAANRSLQRDTSRAIADTALNANVTLQDKINQGRMWGIGGVSGAETTLGGMRQSGLTNAAGLETNLQGLISQYKASGLSMQQATAKALSDISSQDVSNEIGVNTFNTGALNEAGRFNAGAKNDAASFSANAGNQASMFNAGADNSAGMFNAQNANQGQLFNIENAQGQYSKGVGGLQNLQDQTLAQLVGERDRNQALLGGSAQGQLGALGIQSDLAKQPGVGGNIMAGIGAAAGIAGGIMTGGMSGIAGGALNV